MPSFEKYYIEVIKGVLQFLFQLTSRSLFPFTVRHVHYMFQASLVLGHPGKIGTDILPGGLFGISKETVVRPVVLRRWSSETEIHFFKRVDKG